MATFTTRRVVNTRQPRVTVEPGLPPGRYRFELVMIDAEGRERAPVQVTVRIRPRRR